MALRAAVAGQGVVLLRATHVDGGAGSTGLVRLFDLHCPASPASYLVCPEGAFAFRGKSDHMHSPGGIGGLCTC